MRVKLFTFRYSSTLGGFDDTSLHDFVRDKEVLSFREHFFLVNEVPHVTGVLTYQDAVVPAAVLVAAHELPAPDRVEPRRDAKKRLRDGHAPRGRSRTHGARLARGHQRRRGGNDVRRVGNLWPSIVSFANLTRAAHCAALGKRHVAGVARFLADLEPNVLRLQRELEDRSWRPGQAFTFEIHDPKTRTITAAPFRDRVVHHALT